MSHMHLPRFVREKRGFSLTRMGKELGMSQPNYKVFEERGKAYSPERLRKLYQLSGLPLEKFWKEFEKDCSTVVRKKRSDAVELESEKQ